MAVEEDKTRVSGVLKKLENFSLNYVLRWDPQEHNQNCKSRDFPGLCSSSKLVSKCSEGGGSQAGKAGAEARRLDQSADKPAAPRGPPAAQHTVSAKLCCTNTHLLFQFIRQPQCRCEKDGNTERRRHKMNTVLSISKSITLLPGKCEAVINTIFGGKKNPISLKLSNIKIQVQT